MTKEEIVKKLGGIPRIKGSTMYRMYHQPEEYAKKVSEGKKKINAYQHSNEYKKATKPLNPEQQRDYQRKTGRGYHE